MSDLGIGKLITTDQHRDAIHVAVAPVKAGARLLAGEHVGLLPDGRVSGDAKDHIGIVDPYLKEYVLPDEQFWLFLYPNTITALRHSWDHPAFELPVTPVETVELRPTRDYVCPECPED